MLICAYKSYPRHPGPLHYVILEWPQHNCMFGYHFFVSETKKDSERETVKCSEIIAVKLGCDSESHVKGKFHHLEAIAHDSTIFSIWFIERYSQHRWRHRHVSFRSRDSSVAQQWVDEIQAILSSPGLYILFFLLLPVCRVRPVICHSALRLLLLFFPLLTDTVVAFLSQLFLFLYFSYVSLQTIPFLRGFAKKKIKTIRDYYGSGWGE